jgi:hypothetical protein
MFEAYNFAAKWYGDSHAYGDYDDDLKKFNESEFYATCPLFHLGPSHDARLIVELTRQGYSLYGRIPLFEICYEHLFSRWPDAIFEELGQEYQAFQRSLRGPGTGLELPPLTALLLSRAASRSQIPQTLVDMREEYRRDRDELWALLTEMWTAHDLAKQRKLLAKLTGLGRSIFQTAFGRKFDALSIGFELAKLSPAGIAGAADKFRQQKGSRIHVHAVSFAEKLSMDLTNFTMANHAILARHLTKAERVQFGAH